MNLPPNLPKHHINHSIVPMTNLALDQNGRVRLAHFVHSSKHMPKGTIWHYIGHDEDTSTDVYAQPDGHVGLDCTNLRLLHPDDVLNPKYFNFYQDEQG